jgi:hypothetical protein
MERWYDTQGCFCRRLDQSRSPWGKVNLDKRCVVFYGLPGEVLLWMMTERRLPGTLPITSYLRNLRLAFYHLHRLQGEDEPR